MTDRHTVVFQPSGARGEVEAGTPLRTAARRLGVEIESVCAGNTTCGKCLVLVEEGPRGGVVSALEHVTPPGADEAKFLTERQPRWRRSGLDTDRVRLSCRAEVCGDVVVFVPESSRGNRQIVRKSATERPIEIRPSVRRYYVEMEPPTLADPRGDAERLAQALAAVMDRIGGGPDWLAPDFGDLRFDYPVLQRVADVVRAEDWKVSVAVWKDREVIDIRPGYHDAAYGAAIDIGTTAIALYLCDLASGEVLATESAMNPQTALGDDIMARMAYETETEDGLETLRSGIVTTLNTLLERALGTQGLTPDDVLETVVVGNTTMHHFFLNLTTRHLGVAPFVPALQRPLDLKARDLGLQANPAGNVHLLPIEASFVGADNMAVLLAEQPQHQDEWLLIIDVGTNAELVLGNRERLFCTSTPTGPAFEGAHIEYGMRAAPGAIERISIDADTLEPTFTVIGGDAGDDPPAKGICGSAIIDAVAEMFRVGIIDSGGGFAAGVESPRIRRGDLGWEYVVAEAGQTSIGRDIPITLQDVRQVQLAKAALYSAAQILLREAGVARPDKIILAGAFGTRIDPTRALVLGMIPDCPIEDVVSVGNAAGDGARIALLNRDQRREAAAVAGFIERVELPVDPDFQDQYLAALNFPHASHHFPSIAHLLPGAGSDPAPEPPPGSAPEDPL